MPTLGLVQLMGIYLIYDAFQSPLMRTFIETRWTFFRVKLVFEYYFEISWSLCPLDTWTSSLFFYLFDHWRLTFDLYIHVEKLGVVGGGVLRL